MSGDAPSIVYQGNYKKQKNLSLREAETLCLGFWQLGGHAVSVQSGAHALVGKRANQSAKASGLRIRMRILYVIKPRLEWAIIVFVSHRSERITQATLLPHFAISAGRLIDPRPHGVQIFRALLHRCVFDVERCVSWRRGAGPTVVQQIVLRAWLSDSHRRPPAAQRDQRNKAEMSCDRGSTPGPLLS